MLNVECSIFPTPPSGVCPHPSPTALQDATTPNPARTGSWPAACPQLEVAVTCEAAGRSFGFAWRFVIRGRRHSVAWLSADPELRGRQAQTCQGQCGQRV